MAAILAFRLPLKVQNWTNEELAELFRVVDVLARAGVPVETDLGLSDEGDPWFVFCRADTGDVIVHFSRIDGQFVAVSASTDAVVRGVNFRRVAEALVNRQPLILPVPNAGQKLFLHPAVILTALVATTLAQMKSWDGQEIIAVDDVAEPSATIVSMATFTDSLKTALVDALNVVLRGFTGPAETKILPGEHVNPNGLGLVLGNMSLASVVAFAISAIQGPLLDETEIVQRASQPSDGDGAVKKTVLPVAALAAAENKPQMEAPDQKPMIDSKEGAPGKAATRDIVLATAMEKVGASDKSTAAASDEGFTRAVQKELLDALTVVEIKAGDIKAGPVHQKIMAAEIKADALKPAPAASSGAVEQKTTVAAKVVEFQANDTQHRFTITEISKEAVEIFFGKGATIVAGESLLLSKSLGSVSDARLGEDISLSGVAFRIPDGNSEPAIITNSFAPFKNELSGLSATPVSRAALNASDLVFSGGDPVAMAKLSMITDFVNSAASKITATGSFQDSLKPYWDGNSAVTVVVYDSEDLPLNIFSFTKDVLFVEESRLAGTAINFADSTMQIDLANGGDVTLLGVIHVGPPLIA